MLAEMLKEILADGLDLAATGFDEGELDALLGIGGEAQNLDENEGDGDKSDNMAECPKCGCVFKVGA